MYVQQLQKKSIMDTHMVQAAFNTEMRGLMKRLTMDGVWSSSESRIGKPLAAFQFQRTMRRVMK
jgi:hypothetical protein